MGALKYSQSIFQGFKLQKLWSPVPVGHKFQKKYPSVASKTASKASKLILYLQIYTPPLQFSCARTVSGSQNGENFAI